MNNTIYNQNVKLQRLERDLITKDSELSALRKLYRMFDEVLRYRVTLSKLSLTMEQAEKYANLACNSYGRDPVVTVNTDPAPPNTSSVNLDANEGLSTVCDSSELKLGTLVHLAMNGHA